MKLDLFFQQDDTLKSTGHFIIIIFFFSIWPDPIFLFQLERKVSFTSANFDPSHEQNMQSDLSQHWQTLPISIILNNVFSYCSESNPDEFNYTLHFY